MSDQKKKKSNKHLLSKMFSNYDQINSVSIKLIESSTSWIAVDSYLKFFKDGKLIGELKYLDVGVKGHKIKVIEVYQGAKILYKDK